MTRVLITGAEGFIGKNLVNYLKNDYQIIKVDKKTGNDIRNYEVTDIVDYVVHLAAVSDISTSERDQLFTYDTNIEGTINMLNNSFGVRKFINISSAAVYGSYGRPIPTFTEQHKLNPVGVYGTTKLVTEYLLKDFVRRGSFDGVSLRLFNVYGPGQKQGLIGKINNLKDDEVFVIDGDGKQVRDYIHVFDVCRAIRECMEGETNLNGDVFNVSTNIGTSVNEVINIAGDYREFATIQRDGNIGVKRAVGNNLKIKNRLGWEPTISLHRGLEDLL